MTTTRRVEALGELAADLDATMRQPGQRGTYGGRRP